jgi:NADH dehydrogenase FAD-containing subunit
MFDKTLGEYAIKHFRREGITVKTSHHITGLRKGLPVKETGQYNTKDEEFCMTLDVKEEGEVGIGMVVWSTGLMKNPFIRETVNKSQILAPTDAEPTGIDSEDIVHKSWYLKHDGRSGSLITDENLRVIMEPKSYHDGEQESNEKEVRAVMKDVYALGDCAMIEGITMPATAQVASQKADWLGKTLNKGGPHPGAGFKFHNIGIMAYLGDWKAILQPESGANLSGRSAFLVWRGAYLTKSVSWRNKVSSILVDWR